MHLFSTAALTLGLVIALSKTSHSFQVGSPALNTRVQRDVATQRTSPFKYSSLVTRDDGDEGEPTDDDESDFVAGVYEQMSAAIDQIQPSVDQIQQITQNADDSNAEDYSEQINTHLINIVNVGNSVSDSMSSDEETDEGGITAECHSCEHRHRRHRFCHRCRRHHHRECGLLLHQWLELVRLILHSIHSCKSRTIRDRCGEHIPKITSCSARVVSTCGGYGIKSSLQTMPTVDFTAFSNTGFGTSQLITAVYN